MIKCASDVAPGRLRAPARALLANLGKDLTQGPGTFTGAGRGISRPDDHRVVCIYRIKHDE